MTLRLFALAPLLFCLSACDINESMRAKSKNPTTADARALAAKNGCMGCHAVNNTVMGPAWKLVADRYKDLPGSRAILIEKVIMGGSGNWTALTGGRNMPPHSDIPHEEVAVIVDYILTLGEPVEKSNTEK